MPQRIVIDYEKNYEKIAEKLLDLKYKRITRSIQFKDNENYDLITEIVIYNNNKDNICYYIPGEIYEKKILVNFEIAQLLNSRIQVSSNIGDMINIYYLLNRIKSKIKNDKIKNNLENQEFIKELKDAFWKSEKTVDQLLKEAFENDIKLLESEEIKDYVKFLKSMEENFVQFIYIKEGIKPYDSVSIKIKTSKNIKYKNKKCRFIYPKLLEYEIPIKAKNPYPLKGRNTLFFKVNIPDIEKFKFHKLCEKQAKTNNIAFNIERFNIFHKTVNKGTLNPFCEELSKDSRLNKLNIKHYQQVKGDIRSNFSNNLIYIYFRKSQKSTENSEFNKFCEFDHIIKLTRTLKNKWLLAFYWIFFILSVILFFLFRFFNFNHYTEIFIGLLITTTFDFINKTDIEKYYLKYSFIIFLLILFFLYFTFQIIHFCSNL